MRHGSLETVLHRAALVADGAGMASAPGVVLRRGAGVIAAGAPESIGVPDGVRIEEHPGAAILPALGNAHAHLDLSELEPEPFDGDFAAWLGRVRDFRRSLDAARARRSAALGAALLRAGGTALVGDIAGHPLGAAAGEVLREAGIAGVAFVEVFGAGATIDAALRTIEAVESEARGGGGADGAAAAEHGSGAAAPLRLGIQPHAPYSASDAVVERALRSGLPVSIHLAESADEVELCLHGRGALREMLDRFGAVPTDASGSGLHPVDWFCARLRSAPRGAGGAGRLAVHLNAFEAHHAAQLASLGVTAVICPRATAFFGRRGGAWRALRDAGVPVALGTDGRLCLDTPDRISTLDEIRCLARAGEVTLREGLAMATIEVARALGFDEAPFTLAPGEKPGLLLVSCGDDPHRGVLEGREPPQWLFRAGVSGRGGGGGGAP